MRAYLKYLVSTLPSARDSGNGGLTIRRHRAFAPALGGLPSPCRFGRHDATRARCRGGEPGLLVAIDVRVPSQPRIQHVAYVNAGGPELGPSAVAHLGGAVPAAAA